MSGEQKGTQLRAGGGTGYSRNYGHFHEHEGTRDPETKTAENRHDLLGEVQEAVCSEKKIFVLTLRHFLARAQGSKPEQLGCHYFKWLAGKIPN